MLASTVQAMGNWTNQRERSGYTAYHQQSAQRLRIETKDTEQVHLCLALPGVSLFHPKRFALNLLNVILGEGMCSRLFTEIRENRGLAYSIHSYVDHYLDSGAITVSAGVELRNLYTLIEAVLEQLSLLKETIPEPELSRAKEQSKGHLLLRMENSRTVAGWLGGQETLTGQILSVDQVVSIIDGITAEELRQLAQELLIGSQLRLAVVGRVKQDEPLEELLKL
jgi:predicted Zn-dependent peptidase